MNAIAFQKVIIPSPREFALTWKSFFTVTSAIATYRANENGLQRFGELSVHASNRYCQLKPNCTNYNQLIGM